MKDAAESLFTKKDALKEALKRHFRLTKPGQMLSPAEGSYFLVALAGMASLKLNDAICA